MINLSLGFTGSRDGMSILQKTVVKTLLHSYFEKGIRNAHHGVCIGADEDFHYLAKGESYHIVGHPGLRADGKCFTRANVFCDEDYPQKEFLVRNCDIVNMTVVLIATPNGPEKNRSGTWTTVRYARRQNKSVYLVMPDGELIIEARGEVGRWKL